MDPSIFKKKNEISSYGKKLDMVYKTMKKKN